MPPKTSRGQILDFLNRIYPEKASEITIIGVFYQYFRDIEIRRSLQFLVDKGYLEVEPIKHPVIRGKVEKHFKITAEGIEILEGIKEDASILLEADHQQEDSQ